MKYLVVFVLIALSFSCELSDIHQVKIPKNIDYKYHQLGEGEEPKDGNSIGAFIVITSLTGDTLHYVPRYPYFFELGNTLVDSVFMAMKPDDSLSFTMDRKILNDYFEFYQLQESDEGKAVLNIKLTGVYNSEEADSIQKRVLSKREIKEQEALLKYLNEVDINFEVVDGVYRRIEKRNDSTPINYGDEVTIQYVGRFLDGYVFDDTYLKPRPPSFTFGKEYQLIDGLHYGLIGLKEGERLKIILPSRRAFGEEGSVAGIVPPYTTVIFDIHIIKVNKK